MKHVFGHCISLNFQKLQKNSKRYNVKWGKIRGHYLNVIRLRWQYKISVPVMVEGSFHFVKQLTDSSLVL